MEGCMMARMFKPPKSAPTPPAASQEAPEKGAQ